MPRFEAAGAHLVLRLDDPRQPVLPHDLELVIVQHIDRMLEYYKFRCEHSKRAEEMRRYRTIYDLYIAPEPKTQQQIADEEHVDLSTVFRDQKAGISKLSALIFGWLD